MLTLTPVCSLRRMMQNPIINRNSLSQKSDFISFFIIFAISIHAESCWHQRSCGFRHPLNFYRMSTRFSILIAILMSATSCFAQKIFSTDHQYQADVKVFVVDHEYQADLVVYKTDKNYEAKAAENKGIWFFCNSAYQADKKVFFVDHEYQADLKVFFTDRKYKAGWKRNAKKALLY